MSQNTPEIILCEGQSEVAYIQQLSRIAYKYNGISPIPPFTAKLIGQGSFGKVQSFFKQTYKSNPKASIRVWVDKDIYIRNERLSQDLYSKKSKSIPDFFFSEMNFEDFIILHCDDNLIHQWVHFCQNHKHYQVPLEEKNYLHQFMLLLPNYKKGELPFELTPNRIYTMMNNLRRFPIKNDFGIYLSEKITKGDIKFF